LTLIEVELSAHGDNLGGANLSVEASLYLRYRGYSTAAPTPPHR